MRIIKKYSNRRLYDTELSTYINLSDLKKMVLESVAFKVVEVGSGNDITYQVLLQTMLEQEANISSPIFTSKILEYLIRINEDERLQPFLRQYLEQSISMFMDNQDKVNEFFDQMVKYNPFYMMGNMSGLGDMFFGNTKTAPQEPKKEPKKASDEEVDDKKTDKKANKKTRKKTDKKPKTPTQENDSE